VVAGLILLIVRRKARREWASLVDAMTISTGLGLLVWVFIIRPSLGSPLLSVLGQAVVVAYPIADIVVLAMIVRLLIGSGGRGMSYRVLAVTVIMFLAGDMGWATINQLGLEPQRHASARCCRCFSSPDTACSGSRRCIRPCAPPRKGLPRSRVSARRCSSC
jgi:hypothetical protein